jgi:hypothetical protein
VLTCANYFMPATLVRRRRSAALPPRGPSPVAPRRTPVNGRMAGEPCFPSAPHVRGASPAARSASQRLFSLRSFSGSPENPRGVWRRWHAARRRGARRCAALQAAGGAPARDTAPAGTYVPLGPGALGAGSLANVLGDANAFFRKAVLTALGGWPEEAEHGVQDWELLTRAALRGMHVGVVPEPLYWCARRVGWTNPVVYRYSSLQ